MSEILLIVVIVAVGAAVGALHGKPGDLLTVWIAGRHRNCAKAHPGMPHAAWVERVHAPAAASFLAVHGHEAARPVTTQGGHVSSYIGGVLDGRPLDERIATRSERVPWVCHRPARSTEHYLYLRDDAGDFRYAGPCDGTDHDHYEITCASPSPAPPPQGLLKEDT